MLERLIARIAQSVERERGLALPVGCLALILGVGAGGALLLTTPLTDRRIVAARLMEPGESGGRSALSGRWPFAGALVAADVTPLCHAVASEPVIAGKTLHALAPPGFACPPGQAPALAVTRRASLATLLAQSLRAKGRD